MATTTMTICKNCRWHRNTHKSRQAGPPPSTWYYQVCTHPDLERPTTVDPVSGEIQYMLQNDLGRTVLTDEAHPYCRDTNDGDCKLFEAP